MPSPSGNVLVVSPPTLYRRGLLVVLRDTWPDLTITVTADAARVAEALRRRTFALVVLDSLLPDLVLPAQLRLIRPGQRVLVLTGPRVPPAVRQSLSPAHPYALLPRHATPAEVVRTIGGLFNAQDRVLPLPVAATRPVLPATCFSRRELEVLHLIIADQCNQQIADHLYLSVRTVESHRRALLQKAGARTLVGLVVQALREGWVTA